MKVNLIAIHTLSVSTDMTDFAKSGIYRTVPMILYKVNEEKVEYFCIYKLQYKQYHHQSRARTVKRRYWQRQHYLQGVEQQHEYHISICFYASIGIVNAQRKVRYAIKHRKIEQQPDYYLCPSEKISKPRCHDAHINEKLCFYPHKSSIK